MWRTPLQVTMESTVSDALNANSNMNMHELAKADALRDGLFAGFTSGLTGALLGSRFMGFTRNKTIFCGVVTGILSGYLFHQAFLSSNMARLKARGSET